MTLFNTDDRSAPRPTSSTLSRSTSPKPVGGVAASSRIRSINLSVSALGSAPSWFSSSFLSRS